MCNGYGEFQRHILNQHTEDESFVDNEVQLQELNEKAKQLLIEANLYLANYIKELENFNVMQSLECIKKLGSNLKLCKKKSAESFYNDGYNLIVLDSSLMFPGLTPKVATSLPSKFLDVFSME